MRNYYKSYWKNSRQKKEIRLKQFLYNGCLVEIINNKTWSFKYEWVITPISRVTKKACIRFHARKYNDPTSHKTFRYAIHNAKEAVNEIKRPFRLARWKD